MRLLCCVAVASLVACASAPPAPETKAEATPVETGPAAATPALPEAPPMAITPASRRADRVLPGACRVRQVEGFGLQTPTVEVRVTKYDGDRPTAVEAADASGKFLWRAEPKLDAAGRVVEVVRRTSDRKALATHGFAYDAQGRVTRETLTTAGEKEPSFERTVAYDGTGKITSETWRWGETAWTLTPELESSGEVRELDREDGKLAVRFVRDAVGNPLEETRLRPDGSETRILYDYGCFGVDQTLTARLGDLCRDDAHACVRLARLLSRDATALGLAPDPALAEVYRIHACRRGDAASCLLLAEKETDPARIDGFRYHARTLSQQGCKGGDAEACARACKLGDTEACGAVATDEE